jgi:mannose-6-phosphate isomerase-like protein (cupin superfamily)
MISKNLNQPDERREFKDHGHLDVVNFDDGTAIGHGVFEPGWRWSVDVKPLARTPLCDAEHTGYCLKGSMVIRMENGEEVTIRAGDAFHIPPNHDAWVVGNEDCELIDVSGAKNYAQSIDLTEKKAA